MSRHFCWGFVATSACGLVAGLLVAWLVAFLMPKTYESGAVIEVKPRKAAAWDIRPPVSIGEQLSKICFPTVFEKIKSSNSLGTVVDNLNLVNRWGVDRETSIRILKGIVATRTFRDTDRISIKVRHANREDARDIAAEVVRVYWVYRLEMERRDTDLARKALDRSIGDVEDRIGEWDKVFAVSRKQTWGHHLEMRPPGDPVEDDGFTERYSAKEMVDIDPETRQRQEHDRKLLDHLRKWRAEAAVADQARLEDIMILEQPQIASSPVSPNVRMLLAIGEAGGLLLSVPTFLLVWFLKRRDATMPDDYEALA